LFHRLPTGGKLSDTHGALVEPACGGSSSTSTTRWYKEKKYKNACTGGHLLQPARKGYLPHRISLSPLLAGADGTHEPSPLSLFPSLSSITTMHGWEHGDTEPVRIKIRDASINTAWLVASLGSGTHCHPREWTFLGLSPPMSSLVTFLSPSIINVF
jgi:hypothetical protein